MKLKNFNRLKWLVDKPFGVKLLNLLYRLKWFKKRVDNYLEALVTTNFQFRESYKFSQNKYMLAIKIPKGDWSHVIRRKRLPHKEKLKLNKNYTFTVLFESEKYNVLKMTKK